MAREWWGVKCLSINFDLVKTRVPPDISQICRQVLVGLFIIIQLSGGDVRTEESIDHQIVVDVSLSVFSQYPQLTKYQIVVSEYHIDPTATLSSTDPDLSCLLTDSEMHLIM